MSETVAAFLTCCGQPIDEDGYCQYRRGHPRQATPELINKATMAASREAGLYEQVRAVLEVAFAEEA